MKAPMDKVDQGILLPHQMINSIYERYQEAWSSSILPSKTKLNEFWQSVRGHPQMEGHPAVSVPGYDECFIPLAVHGDGVPIVGVGKIWSRTMTMFSFYSLVGEGWTQDLLFYIWSIYDKLILGNLSQFFAVLKWSFLALYHGKWPDRDHAGKLFLGWTAENEYGFCITIPNYHREQLF